MNISIQIVALVNEGSMLLLVPKKRINGNFLKVILIEKVTFFGIGKNS